MCLNGVVAENPIKQRQENFFMPEPVARAMRDVFAKHPEWKKRKWWFYVAAALDLISSGEDEMMSRVQRIAGSAAGGDAAISKLVDEAKRDAEKADVLFKQRSQLEAQANQQATETPPQLDPTASPDKPVGRKRK